ncbi:bifunctional adenosylcobinamide kinase/adenosylcobinamide-phosphate guanylyltransferase [Sphingobium sp. CCH11-B1]|jgi:adenosylcobinamide kinase/adenosylcobinamide-phosphate guanylyltransferase|uniref:bifunctional adenosylcobinamide kinase/adenosylcobinamide-phosphate guanylyltransferase n=1 Tax=Sphingobium sp. CCH11-B1 TaxID=1768781 RepID=UPI00082D9B42|nr:bifunctional adenosylcobinamide kinase/adenosylcobinamide-phosphate guanylyltransferase [Sphingobium sp. CCH11-B1]MEA3389882.1 bifunctional adenosylcobinamide kinase/adenosylcobinamide-phosphate guanylyltransferase [Pseudomonadota bacterium]
MTGLLLVLGGARSGKSRHAQARAEATGLDRLFVATAQAFDDEMRDRIDRHRQERSESWRTVEAPVDIAAALDAHAAPDRVILVDCLTLWTTNLILGDHDVTRATDALVSALARAAGPVILVANEVGLGIVPDNALARRFRDAAGLVNQHVAAACAEVQFLAAGLPLTLKQQG